jgi:hypothetical protein
MCSFGRNKSIARKVATLYETEHFKTPAFYSNVENNVYFEYTHFNAVHIELLLVLMVFNIELDVRSRFTVLPSGLLDLLYYLTEKSWAILLTPNSKTRR